jgi:hypothetical protein
MHTYMRQHTSAYVSIRQHCILVARVLALAPLSPYNMYAYVSIRQHTPAYVSIRQHTSA